MSNTKLGKPVPNWVSAALPEKKKFAGQYCIIEPLNPQQHARALYDANVKDHANAMWNYLPYGPFRDFEDYLNWMNNTCLSDDPMFFALIEKSSGLIGGVCALMRIEPKLGSMEVGHIAYSPILSRTTAATEAMYLLMEYAFSLGYRRYEWKCNALNKASRAAAQRLGFSYEGVFRNSSVIKGHNRDTAWYAMIEEEWPTIKATLQRWLKHENFDDQGRQINPLSEMTEPLLYKSG